MTKAKDAVQSAIDGQPDFHRHWEHHGRWAQRNSDILKFALEHLQDALDEGWQDIESAVAGQWILGKKDFTCGISGRIRSYSEVMCWSGECGGIWKTTGGKIFKPTHYKLLNPPSEKKLEEFKQKFERNTTNDTRPETTD